MLGQMPIELIKFLTLLRVAEVFKSIDRFISNKCQLVVKIIFSQSMIRILI